MNFVILIRGYGNEIFDSLEDANARASALRNRGFRCFVEARDARDETAIEPTILNVIEALEQPRCRQIRWAGVAP